MRKSIRAALAVGVGATALTFAGSAFAAFTPKIFIRGATAAAGGVTVDARFVTPTDDPTARVSFYVPNGYQMTTPTAGATIGKVTATAQAADLGGATLPLTGDVLAATPTQFATQQAQCGVATAASTWDLHLTAAGQTLDVPVFVVATAGPEAAVGPFKLVICLPPPDVPVGTPGRAQFGAKLLTAAFNSTALTSPTASGTYRWTSAWTPYNPGLGTARAAGTVEVQSLVNVPTKLSLASKKVAKKAGKKTKTSVSLTATLVEGTAPIPSVSVSFLANGKAVKSVTTSQSGKASLKVLAPAGKKTTYTAKAVLADRDLGASACTATAIFGGVPCIDATVAGQTLASNSVVVVAKK